MLAVGGASRAVAYAEPGALAGARTAGTTLAQAATAGQARKGGYRRLVAGPGWPLVVRQELAGAKSSRENTRTGVAAFVQLTDMHVTDVQSPARFEYTHPLISSAFRPQESLTTQGAVSLIKRINSLPGGPFTGRRFDAVVTTGDNTDNREYIELDWFLRVLSGGSITPNTGARGRFEGVQNDGSSLYWQPSSSTEDIYKQRGFVEIPKFLRAAITTYQSPGLNTPWYCVFGNHDDQLVGTVPNGILDWMYLSSVRFDLPSTDPAAVQIAQALQSNPAALGPLLAQLRITGPTMPATPDARRRPFSPQEFVRKHFEPAYRGPGPVGHGFRSPDGPTWYTFTISPGVLGIAMNTCNSLGLSDGSISEVQWQWVQRQIAAHPDHLVMLFSHHTSDTMTAKLPNPETPGQRQYGGEEMVEMLKRHRNVIAWVNGHTHDNRLIPHRGKTPKHSFWEINTASHIDYPQLARIIEITDNGDGTLSLFTALIEAESKYTGDEADLSPDGLATLYREMSYNDIHRDPDRMGSFGDRNAELLLTHPLR